MEILVNFMVNLCYNGRSRLYNGFDMSKLFV
jgi:hypothetical protein